MKHAARQETCESDTRRRYSFTRSLSALLNQCLPSRYLNDSSELRTNILQWSARVIELKTCPFAKHSHLVRVRVKIERLFFTLCGLMKGSAQKSDQARDAERNGTGILDLGVTPWFISVYICAGRLSLP